MFFKLTEVCLVIIAISSTYGEIAIDAEVPDFAKGF